MTGNEVRGCWGRGGGSVLTGGGNRVTVATPTKVYEGYQCQRTHLLRSHADIHNDTGQVQTRNPLAKGEVEEIDKYTHYHRNQRYRRPRLSMRRPRQSETCGKRP